MRSVLFPVVSALGLIGLLWPGLPAGAAEKQANSASATVRVLVPKNAKVTVDGKELGPKSGTRRLLTLPVEKGEKNRFTIQAEFKRGKKTITIRQRVLLRAGQKKVVSLRSRRTYGRSARPSRGAVSTYRLNVSHPYDPAYGTYSYRDMRAYAPGVRD